MVVRVMANVGLHVMCPPSRTHGSPGGAKRRRNCKPARGKNYKSQGNKEVAKREKMALHPSLLDPEG
eukprot:1145678-Pelagomonas_calceolata.AAC.7